MEQRRLDLTTFLSPLPGLGMDVSDMASYPHYPPHYSYQVSIQHVDFVLTPSFYCTLLNPIEFF